MSNDAHALLIWNDFGQDMWNCNQCGQMGSSHVGDRPEDKLPCLSPREREPLKFTPFGHRDLRSSDFGWWTCRACDQSGDDWSHPRDFPCTTDNEETAVTENLTDEELDALDTEEEFIKNYDLKKYPAQAVTADLAIFTIRNDALAILLIQRNGHPEKGKWALPGGFVNVDETADEAAGRELQEETSLTLEAAHLEQLKTYTGPNRDPRGYIASVAYVALVPKVANPKAGSDANVARFFPVNDVLEEFNLAFDHRQIILDGLERVRAKLEYAPLAPKFLEDETFTMSELRRVYEVVWDVELNPSNFRRKVQSVKGFLEAVGDKRASQIEGGRASDLYRAGDLDLIFPPLRRRDAVIDAGESATYRVVQDVSGGRAGENGTYGRTHGLTKIQAYEELGELQKRQPKAKFRIEEEL